MLIKALTEFWSIWMPNGEKILPVHLSVEPMSFSIYYPNSLKLDQWKILRDKFGVLF